MELQGIYRALGVSPAVYDFGQQVLDGLRERFANNNLNKIESVISKR